jgi:Lytic transglycolase
MAVLGRRLFALAAAVVVAASGVGPAEGARLVTMLWVDSYELCMLVPGAMCLQTAGGPTLQVIDPSVTAGGSDCVDLPETHGAYVRVFDGLSPEALEPDLTAQMRTGTCAAGTVDELDTVFVNADAYLNDPIDASVSVGHKAFDGTATYYSSGVEACGGTVNDSDLTVALPASMFNPSSNGNPDKNPLCGRKIHVRGPKGSAQVYIKDVCPNCGPDALDLSPAAFKAIADVSDGRVSIDWQVDS